MRRTRKTCGASFDTEREKTVAMAEMATEMFGFRRKMRNLYQISTKNTIYAEGIALYDASAGWRAGS